MAYQARILLPASVVARLLLAVAVVVAGPEFNIGEFRSAFATWPPGETPTLATRFATWDSAHYLKLSQEGYKAGSHSCAFYPLWPLVIRATTALTGGWPVLTSLLLANALSL
ncbi:MAG TPA: mannosyltransferase family protein, partial [Candidatus Paceibacterota bacterium]|nr:mannosyltransferase family protein [Candidatus Paceibacterota bacterium]